MSTPTQGPYALREQRARQEARPELNRDHYDILVGRPYGEKLRDFLQQNGVRVVRLVEAFVDIIEITRDSDLDRVERLIDDWMNGADFTP